MRSFFKAILKFLGFPDTTPVPTTEPVPERKPFDIEHEWPFTSPVPQNVDYLLNELIKGVKVEGDHVFFFWEGKKRRHLRTPAGTETILARHLVWWMEGRKCPKAVASGLTTNCGEPKCIKLSHLVLKLNQTPHGPAPKPATPVIQTVKPKKEPRKAPDKEEPKPDLDRNHCISRKAYFADEISARQEKNKLNRKHAGRGPKLYVYPCKLMDCGGWHLTKINPEKYNKSKRKRRAIHW